jgi:hypothetical protein
VVEILLEGERGGSKEGDRREWKLARLRARRYKLFDGGRKGLFFMERGGKVARCIDEDRVSLELFNHHDCHGHFAGKMLLSRLFSKFYWPSRAKDAHYYAQSCRECQLFGPVWPSEGLKTMVHLRPMDMVGLDFIGPITPVTKAGNKYIIILVDYFSRYLFARAVQAATYEAAWGLFSDVVAQLGWSLSAYTDNESHFTGHNFQGFLEVYGVVRHYPARKTQPSSVRLSEKYVRLLMNVLKKTTQNVGKQ